MFYLHCVRPRPAAGPRESRYRSPPDPRVEPEDDGKDCHARVGGHPGPANTLPDLFAALTFRRAAGTIRPRGWQGTPGPTKEELTLFRYDASTLLLAGSWVIGSSGKGVAYVRTE